MEVVKTNCLGCCDASWRWTFKGDALVNIEAPPTGCAQLSPMLVVTKKYWKNILVTPTQKFGLASVMYFRKKGPHVLRGEPQLCKSIAQCAEKEEDRWYDKNETRPIQSKLLKCTRERASECVCILWYVCVKGWRGSIQRECCFEWKGKTSKKVRERQREHTTPVHKLINGFQER